MQLPTRSGLLPRPARLLQFMLPVLLLGGLLGQAAPVEVQLRSAGLPTADKETERADALGLPVPALKPKPGKNACAVYIQDPEHKACFAESEDAEAFISGKSKKTIQIQPTGIGGIALTNNYFGFAKTCQVSDCSSGHELFWYTSSDGNCTHKYPYNDMYVNYVDHGYEKLENYGAGRNCNRVVMYNGANQPGAGAQNCWIQVCYPGNSRYSFSMHNG